MPSRDQGKWHNPTLILLPQQSLQMLHRVLHPISSPLSSLLLVVTLLLQRRIFVHPDALVDALMSVKNLNYMTVHLLPPAGSPGF
jgi:hypothetical protein